LDTKWLNDIIHNLIKNDQKQGCFSRDPYTTQNTFINSGSFVLKNNDITKQMYKNLIHELNSNVTYHNNWPYDQYYISKYIFQNNEQFVIFVPDILNCPTGKVLRHNWFKDEQMYDDLNTLIKTEDIMADKTSFIETDYYDDKNNFQSCSEYVQSI